MNRALKDATVGVFHYEDLESLKVHVLTFVTACNFGKHLKSLRGKTPFQTICRAWTKDPDRFKSAPHHLIPGPFTQGRKFGAPDAPGDHLTVGIDAVNVKRLLGEVDREHLHGSSPSRSRPTWARSGRRPSHNAPAETINGLFKAEVIHRRGSWRSFEAVEFATLEWVNRRLLEPIGNVPPAEAEACYDAQAQEPALAA